VIYGWGGWFDAVTAHAVIHRFMSLKNPQIAVIGAWNHGANQHASPYCPQALNVAQHWHESLRFFDHFLREETTSAGSDAQARTLYYYTIGAERWNKTDTWPPAGISQQRWYLHADHLLAQEQPAEADAFDDYTIDFSATTGRTNRWYTQMGGESVLYPDRAQADERLLTYTSAPLTADLEITGNAIITLYVKSTADDGAFFVYLEDVAPDGTVYYLTEGQLRAAHRRISSEIPPYVHVEPYHSFRRADLMPWVPGEIAEICVGLQPISALIRQGHRIRIAIAGADCDLFPRIPASGTPTISVQRNQVYGSHIDLPVMMREADHA
jgi:hypothetical protein